MDTSSGRRTRQDLELSSGQGRVVAESFVRKELILWVLFFGVKARGFFC